MAQKSVVLNVKKLSIIEYYIELLIFIITYTHVNSHIFCMESMENYLYHVLHFYGIINLMKVKIYRDLQNAGLCRFPHKGDDTSHEF
jgi:hypothetical protein